MSSIRRDVLVTVTLGAVFICLGSLRTLLIKFSENPEGRYNYLPVSVNVCSEFLKLIICSGLALRVIVQEYQTGKGVLCGGREDVLRFMEWCIPGLLYFIDNLITFYTMEYFQPAMVVLLGNFYIITTSLLYRLILKRQFSRPQWTAVVILFLSIMLLSLQTDGTINVDHHKSHHAIAHQSMAAPEKPIVNVRHSDSTNASKSKRQLSSESPYSQNDSICVYSTVDTSSNRNDPSRSDNRTSPGVGQYQAKRAVKFHFHEGHVLVLFQCLISSTANVYNEKIFKENGGLDESIYVQNSKLYLFGLIFNIAGMLIHGGYREKLLKCGMFSGHNYFSMALILVTAFYGLTVALIFKFKDNMFHVLSTQITTVLVVSASIYYFGFKPPFEFFLAAPIVLASIYLFNITKPKESLDLDADLRLVEDAPPLFREEHRPLVAILDQNED